MAEIKTDELYCAKDREKSKNLNRNWVNNLYRVPSKLSHLRTNFSESLRMKKHSWKLIIVLSMPLFQLAQAYENELCSKPPPLLKITTATKGCLVLEKLYSGRQTCEIEQTAVGDHSPYINLSFTKRQENLDQKTPKIPTLETSEERCFLIVSFRNSRTAECERRYFNLYSEESINAALSEIKKYLFSLNQSVTLNWAVRANNEDENDSEEKEVSSLDISYVECQSQQEFHCVTVMGNLSFCLTKDIACVKNQNFLLFYKTDNYKCPNNTEEHTAEALQPKAPVWNRWLIFGIFGLCVICILLEALWCYKRRAMFRNIWKFNNETQQSKMDTSSLPLINMKTGTKSPCSDCPNVPELARK